MEYYSFEKVLKELQMEEDELKRLVSEGEIRAFRDEDKMKFKRSDIDGLKKGRMTEPTIILPSGEPEDSAEDSEVLLVEEDTSETLLDIDDLDGAETSSTSVPTVDFSSSEFDDDSSASETITEELTFEEDSGSYVLESSDDVLIDSSGDLMDLDSGGDTFIDSDTGLQTEPLEMDHDIQEDDFGMLDDEPDETMQIEEDEEFVISQGGLTSQEGRATTPMIVPRMMAAKPLSPMMTGLLVASTLIMIISSVLMISIVRETDTKLTSGLTDTLYGIAPTAPGYNGKKKSDSKIKSHVKWRQTRRAK